MYLPLSRKQSKFYKEPNKIIAQDKKQDVPNSEIEEVQTEGFKLTTFTEFVKWKDKKKKIPHKISGG
jgi:hypothetical protein